MDGKGCQFVVCLFYLFIFPFLEGREGGDREGSGGIGVGVRPYIHPKGSNPGRQTHPYWGPCACANRGNFQSSGP